MERNPLMQLAHLLQSSYSRMNYLMSHTIAVGSLAKQTHSNVKCILIALHTMGFFMPRTFSFAFTLIDANSTGNHRFKNNWYIF